LAVYERRSGSGGAAQSIDPDMTREQQLETEVAELRFVEYFLVDPLIEMATDRP